MSAPRTKRRFGVAASDPAQRQITAFFTTTGRASSAISSGCGNDDDYCRPVLPADTQSNLLSVGMRVRSSIPEGYKTGGYSAFNPFADDEPIRNNTTSQPPVTRAPSSLVSQRELLPFCGINKTGGLSAQPPFEPDTTPSLPPRVQDLGIIPSIDDVPSLSCSQESVQSNASIGTPPVNMRLRSTALNNRKRVYDESDESDSPSLSDCLQVSRGEWMDGEVSPCSLVPVGWKNTRVMAIPRKPKRDSKMGCRSVHQVAVTGVRGGVAVPSPLDQLGQEKMAVDEDFPEADFLDYNVLGHDAMDI